MTRFSVSVAGLRPSAGGGGQGGSGATGPTGPAGTSAYQSAVLAGFEGTEQQWLASLVGQDGAVGPTGAQGNSGPTGATGADSAVEGPTGPAGEQGDAGEDGQFTFVLATVPENGVEGNSWFNSSNGQIYVFYDGFWVESASSNIGPQGPTGPAGVQVVAAPALSTSPGEVGQIAFDSEYIYICTEQNTWIRATREAW